MEEWQHRVSLNPRNRVWPYGASWGWGSILRCSNSAAGHITRFWNLLESFADGFSINEAEIPKGSALTLFTR